MDPEKGRYKDLPFSSQKIEKNLEAPLTLRSTLEQLTTAAMLAITVPDEYG